MKMLKKGLEFENLGHRTPDETPVLSLMFSLMLVLMFNEITLANLRLPHVIKNQLSIQYSIFKVKT